MASLENFKCRSQLASLFGSKLVVISGSVINETVSKGARMVECVCVCVRGRGNRDRCATAAVSGLWIARSRTFLSMSVCVCLEADSPKRL